MHTFVDPLSRAERCAGDRLAVVCGDRRRTYHDVADGCRRTVGALLTAGAMRGDRIAVLAPNSDYYLDLYVGAPAGGFAIMPMNTRHAIPELRYQLDDAGARILIASGDVGELAGCVDRVIDIDKEWPELVQQAESAPLGLDVSSGDIAGLFYTGGTTGASKGVVLTHQNLIANAWSMLVSASMGDDDVYLIMAPMFHAAGTVAALSSIWLGATQVILPAFDADAALDLIEGEGVTLSLGVPTMVAALNRAQAERPRDTGSLRMLYYGGSPIATDVVRGATSTFPAAEMCHLYGATELAPLATTLRHHERFIDGDLGRSAGPPVIGVDVQVRADDGSVLPADEVGQVTVRGPNVMREYWNKPEQSAEVLRDGWYWTGDLGYQNEEGHLFLVDRAKDMIISGGENIYSTEVEEILFQHPRVREAAVFGIPDEEWGEAVHATVVPEGEVTAEELIEHCRQFIAGYKVPKSIEFRSDALPVSGPGKVLKRELRAPYWQAEDRSIH